MTKRIAFPCRNLPDLNSSGTRWPLGHVVGKSRIMEEEILGKMCFKSPRLKRYNGRGRPEAVKVISK